MIGDFLISTPALTPAALGWSAPSGAQWALLLMAFVLAVEVARRSYRQTIPKLTAGRRLFLTSLRVGALLLLLTLILEPVLTSHLERELDPTVLVLVDDSASMGIEDVEGRSRLQAASGIAERIASELESRATQLRVVVASGARRMRLGSGVAGQARGEGTDLRSLVVSAEQRFLEENLRAVVLLSDGRSTQGARSTPSSSGSRRARSIATKVFAISVGDSAGAADLRLDRVRYPALVRRGDRVQIDGELISEAARAGSSTLELRRDGELLGSQKVSWNPDSERQPFQFVVTADSLGWQRLELSVKGLESELLAANNTVQIAYEVQKDRLRVLYVEARPTWNAHFLRRQGERDRRFEFLVAHLGETGMVVAGEDTTLAWPLADDRWQEIDLFVAGTLDDYRRLVAETPLVASVRAGAGLWVLAAGGAGSGVPSLSAEAQSILPLRPRGRWRMTSGEYRAEITPQGRRHPLLQWDAELGDVADRLAQLPPFALTLGPAEPSPDAQVLLRARSGPWNQPLLTVRNEGRGSVAMWSGAPLWTWSFWRLGDDDNEDVFAALVDNLLSQLAEGASRERLRLQLPDRVVAVGSESLLHAVVLDPQFRPDDSSEVWLEWAKADSTSGGGGVQRLPMPLDPSSPGSRQLPLPSLPPGEYRLRVAIEGDAGREGATSAWTDLSVDAYSVEFRNPRPDPASLRTLAESTGGRMLAGPSDDSWIDQLDLEPRHEVELSRLDLWSSWWALLPLLTLLTVEWTLRRRWGLL